MSTGYITETELTILRAAANIAGEASVRYDLNGRMADGTDTALRCGRTAEALDAASQAIHHAMNVHSVYGTPPAVAPESDTTTLP